MRFNIYGRSQLEIRQQNGSWEVYRQDPAKRVKAEDLVMPFVLEPDDIGTYLDDLYQELASGRDSKLQS